MSNCLKVIIDNDAQTIVFGDCYGKNKKYEIGKEGVMFFLLNKANDIYKSNYNDCDSVSVYNGELFVCALENEIDFSDITFEECCNLVDKELAK